MHTAGKVFAVLNVLLAGAWLYLSAPVVQNRLKLRKEIDDNRAKVPVLQNDIQGLELTRKNLINDLLAAKADIANVSTRSAEVKADLDGQIARLTDRVNDMQATLALFETSIKGSQEQIAARKAEAAELSQTIAAERQSTETLKAENADLTGKLAAARSGLAKARQENAEKLARLVALEEKILQEPAAKKVADASD